jgi:acetylornithine deacetylase
MAVDREFCLSVLQQLVRIDSVNPSLVPGARGEAVIGDYVAGVLSDIGLEAQRHEPVPGRVSVTGRLAGRGGGRSLMLNGHYDTVGVDGMQDPFSAAVRDGRLYGRGAFDMKGAVAACITAAKALAEQGTPLAGDVLVAAVADEEYGSVGTADLAARLRVDGAIVTEPTGLRVCLAHKGYQWIRVETEGRAAHGSRVDLGIDANLRMGRVLAGLERLEQQLRRRTPHPLVGPPSLHAALLQGGSGLSTYAAGCTLQIERRTIPGETEASVMAEIAGILDPLRREDPELRVSAQAFFVREPFEISPDAPVVAALEAAATATLGAAPERYGDTPWMDAALLAAAGTETVVFGPTGAGAHADEEWVDLESVYRTAEVLVEAARRYCVA